MSPTSHIERSMELVREMARFLETGDLNAMVSRVGAGTDPKALRLICIELLGWLRSGAGKSKLRTLRIREFGSSAAQLSSLLDSDSEFSEVFAINAADEIGLKFDGERADLCNLSTEVHTPPRFTTPRR